MKPRTRPEIISLAFIFLNLLAAIIISFKNPVAYDTKFANEDGYIEWLTVLGLLMIAGAALRYLIKYGKHKKWMLSMCMTVLALLCIFAAGEEISWGQRIFHIESSEYFQEHNAQHETNIHNLVVEGKKLNKIIFSTLLGICVGIYIIVLPLFYQFSQKIRKIINAWGIPIAQWYQILAIGIVGALHAIIKSPAGKQPETLEFCMSALFFLIVAFPRNTEAFRIPRN